MKKLNKDQSGVAHLAAILLVVIVVAIGAVAWRVWDSNNKEKSITTNTQNTSEDTLASNDQEVKPIDQYKDWLTCNDSDEKVSFKYPSSWGKTCDFETVDGVGSATLITKSKYPQGFRINYFSAQKTGRPTGSTKPDKVLEVIPLNVEFKGKQLYAVLLSDEWSTEGKALTMTLSDTKYAVGQSVAVTAVPSATHPGTFIRIDAKLGDHAHEGEQFSIEQYKASPDYQDVLKLLKSFSSN